jgi:hypothetical protein
MFDNDNDNDKDEEQSPRPLSWFQRCRVGVDQGCLRPIRRQRCGETAALLPRGFTGPPAGGPGAAGMGNLFLNPSAMTFSALGRHRSG